MMMILRRYFFGLMITWYNPVGNAARPGRTAGSASPFNFTVNFWLRLLRFRFLKTTSTSSLMGWPKTSRRDISTSARFTLALIVRSFLVRAIPRGVAPVGRGRRHLVG